MQKYLLFMVSMHINLEETPPLSLNHKIHLLGQCVLRSGQYTIASEMWGVFFNSTFVTYYHDYSATKTSVKVPET